MTQRYEEGVPENLRVLSEHTFDLKFPLWMQNFGENFADIKEGKNLATLQNEHDGLPAIVIGAGYPVFQLNHLNMLKKANPKAVIIATDKMLKPCLDKGISPTYVTTIDGDPQIAAFFANRKAMKWTKEGTVIINVMAHPITAKTIKGKKYWFISMIDDPFNKRSITAALHFIAKIVITHTLGNVGGFSWNLAYFLGCNPIALIGMPFSYPENTPFEKSIYYDSFLKTLKENKRAQSEITAFFRKDYNEFFNNYSLSDIIWDSYACVFSNYIDKAYEQHKLRTINCTGAGILHPPRVKNIQSMHFKDFLKMIK